MRNTYYNYYYNKTEDLKKIQEIDDTTAICYTHPFRYNVFRRCFVKYMPAKRARTRVDMIINKTLV